MNPLGDVRDDGVAAAAPYPVDLQGRALPEALQGGVPVLAVGLGDAEVGRELVVVERHRVELRSPLRGWAGSRRRRSRATATEPSGLCRLARIVASTWAGLATVPP